MNQAFLYAENLSKRYGKRVAVADVSFDIRPGEVFGLLGPNGAGKTTTLAMLSALIKPDTGTIHVGGFDLQRQRHKAKPLIGVVPQDIALYPTLSARANLEFFGSMYGLGGGTLRKRIDELLLAVGLVDRARDTVQTFSGGMKRRINIAAGMLHKPRILFLDEPTVGVDPQSRNFIFEYVEHLKREGTAIVYTTHYMEESERLCDRIAIVNEGRIIALGTPDSLKATLGDGVIRLRVNAEHSLKVFDAIDALDVVRGVTMHDGALEVQAANANSALADLIQVCVRLGAPVQSLELLRPNLESVFLKLTGKKLRD